MNKTLSKSQKEKQSVLAFLDAEDAKVPANPGLNNQNLGGEFEKLFAASTQEQDFKVGDVVKAVVKGVNIDKTNGLLIDIGYKALSATDSCCYCPDRRRNLDGVWWYSDAMFAPLDELEQAISELLEETDVVVK